ncbi:6-phosphogluconolactonase [Arsenicicoccus dermatophilus]|uniref:6-phosphogluconolactonase n=1 Tax=Arsenicicoccus dermatophilus TaxID=1076331 RepID=UPI00391750E2
MTAAQVVVHPDRSTLAAAVAARLVTTLTDAQSRHGEVHVVLTGGSMGTASMEALVASPAVTAVAWELVHLWWGDERFVERASADRNAEQARQAGLGRLHDLGLPEGNVHELPALDDGLDLEPAAQRYAGELARVAQESSAPGADGLALGRPGRDGLPAFDVVMLGVGPDAHVASLFPGQATLGVTDRTVVAEPDAPKPPPARLSLSLPALCTADEVWLLVAGEDKADAVATALGGAGVVEAPAAGVQGRRRTLWLLDEDAASRLV